jgi:hypothetical protein
LDLVNNRHAMGNCWLAYPCVEAQTRSRKMRLTQEQPPWQDGVPASALQASSAPFDEMKKAP